MQILNFEYNKVKNRYFQSIKNCPSMLFVAPPVNAEISAEGEIELMGTHVGMSGTAGIKFVFNMPLCFTISLSFVEQRVKIWSKEEVELSIDNIL
jgi:hypothetical protein